MTCAAQPTESLYLSEDEIAHKVLGTRKAKDWSMLAALWEREGLPRVDALVGRRYWPAVRRWLDRRNGLAQEYVPASADGKERWSETGAA